MSDPHPPQDEEWLVIDGELIEVTDVPQYASGMVCEGNREWMVFKDEEDAGQAARSYWEDMAKDDPGEFRCMVGEECLVNWCLGVYDGPGSTKVKSLGDWLDLWLDTPEEHFASYDSNPCDVNEVSEALEDALGFTPTVAYRTN